jgi:NAD(P)-dependent dehydrogenase (short-subunit alcohol dehydrogenase family)
MDLTNRVVLLTGAKRIGADVAAAVAARGADVALTYNSSRREADETAAVVRRAGRRALAVQLDVSNPAQWDAAVGEIERELGRLDVFVAMASLYEEVRVDDLDAARWDRQLNVDLRGTFLGTRAVTPIMRRAGGGRIITFTDWVAASGRPRYKGYTAYYVAKAGVKALTESLALELAKDHILVNAIAPGPILPPPGTSPEEIEAVERQTPLGRWGGPGEITKAVLALIDSDFITGETIRVDGGKHLY